VRVSSSDPPNRPPDQPSTDTEFPGGPQSTNEPKLTWPGKASGSGVRAVGSGQGHSTVDIGEAKYAYSVARQVRIGA
jgi:hypothetical protein